ncbi:MAG: biotin--[acetyl-CoA-carboxylase] ligase, partial [Muribaculaceae bacterium]|nr:biotin--[acetyl-CoA-carboxylase] ligase [Muribaculaceae bacterium]
MDIIEIEETASTNTLLRQMPDAPHATVLSAKRQSAGRGQRGNTWEAEPGANLTFSILVRPLSIPPAKQMAISRAVALAIVRWLDRYLPDGMEASVKWPNDIYDVSYTPLRA